MFASSCQSFKISSFVFVRSFRFRSLFRSFHSLFLLSFCGCLFFHCFFIFLLFPSAIFHFSFTLCFFLSFFVSVFIYSLISSLFLIFWFPTRSVFFYSSKRFKHFLMHCYCFGYFSISFQSPSLPNPVQVLALQWSSLISATQKLKPQTLKGASTCARNPRAQHTNDSHRHCKRQCFEQAHPGKVPQSMKLAASAQEILPNRLNQFCSDFWCL